MYVATCVHLAHCYIFYETGLFTMSYVMSKRWFGKHQTLRLLHLLALTWLDT